MGRRGAPPGSLRGVSTVRADRRSDAKRREVAWQSIYPRLRRPGILRGGSPSVRRSPARNGSARRLRVSSTGSGSARLVYWRKRAVLEGSFRQMTAFALTDAPERRSDLVFGPAAEADGSRTLHDPAAGRYFRLGPVEALIVERLD